MSKITCFIVLLAVASGGTTLILPETPVVAAAPAVALPAPIVTARSSQVVSRNYNRLIAAPLTYAAPGVVAAPVSVPLTVPSHVAPAPLSYTGLDFVAPVTYGKAYNAYPYHTALTNIGGTPLIFKK